MSLVQNQSALSLGCKTASWTGGSKVVLSREVVVGGGSPDCSIAAILRPDPLGP